MIIIREIANTMPNIKVESTVFFLIITFAGLFYGTIIGNYGYLTIGF